MAGKMGPTHLIDDAGQEERERVERAVCTSIHEHPQPDLPVEERLEDHAELEVLSRCRELIITLQAADDDNALRLGEELGCVREVLDDPERDRTGDDRCETLCS
jgi:hypothetical protein